MKTTTTLLLSGITAALLCATGNAQIIYSNSFTGGTNTVNGTAPTVANSLLGGTNTGLWVCTFTNGISGTVYANGTIATNGGCALLPFTPKSGAIYYLTASITVPSSMNTWVSMGFSQLATQTNNPGYARFTDSPSPNGYAWMNPRVATTEQFFPGPKTTIDDGAAANLLPSAGTYTMEILLNTFGAKWTTSAYVNGVIVGTNVVGGSQLGTNYVYGSNPTIGFAGIGENSFTAATTGIQWNYLALSTASLPVFTQQPVSGVASAGTAFTNVATALADTNGGTLFYQWYSNNVAIAGATTTSLVFNPVSAADANTNLYVVVTNTYGAVTSSVVSLAVYTKPVFTAELPITYTSPMILYAGAGIGGTNYVGSTPTFSVSVLGGVPWTYQWYANGAAVTGATTASFTFTNAQTGSPSNFSVVVSNSYGAITNGWSGAYQPAPVAPYPQAVLAAQPVGFWRLNEQGNATIADDYASGNNGIYNNVGLGQSGYNAGEQTETSAIFGEGGGTAYVGQIEGVDFAANSGVNAEFSVEAWVSGFGASSGAPIVSKGVYGVSDAFGLGVDTNASQYHYQFYVRSAGGTVYTADSSVTLDGNWHHLVGVCDEANGAVSLYIDGALAASTSIPAKAGEYEANAPVTFGAGTQNTNSGYTLQFFGYMADVAVYDYALSLSEVAAQYGTVGNVGPVFVQTPPASVTNDAGATLVLPATLTGTPPMGYYWTDVNAGTNVAAGTTNSIQLNATLTVPGIPANWNGDQLELTVTNAYGSTNIFVTLNVLSGAPEIVANVQSPFYAALGGAASNSVTVSGSLPFYYQWQFNGNNLTNNGRITGAQSSMLNIANVQNSDAGSYQVIISNAYGPVASGIAPLIIVNDLPIAFNGAGLGWTPSQLGTFTSPAISNGVLTLTDGGGSEARSYFFDYPQYIGAFQASFTYQAAGARGADGVAFVIQNDSAGAGALGHDGGQLGVGAPGAITNSAELELNIYSDAGLGFVFHTNGVTGSFVPPGNVSLGSGHPINIGFYYAAGQASVTFTDTVASTSFSTNFYVGDLTQAVGGTNTAYVGFTGGDGGVTSIQTISNFSFVSIPTATIQMSGPNAVISWPQTILGYSLQENSNLTTTNWATVTNLPVVANGQNQVALPASRTSLFYRLILP